MIVRQTAIIIGKTAGFFGHLRWGRRSREARTGLAAARPFRRGKAEWMGPGEGKGNESGWMYLFILVQLRIKNGEDSAKEKRGLFCSGVVRMGSIIDGVLPEFLCWASHDLSVRRLLVIIGKTGEDFLGLIMPFLQDCDTRMSGPPAFHPRSPKARDPSASSGQARGHPPEELKFL